MMVYIYWWQSIDELMRLVLKPKSVQPPHPSSAQLQHLHPVPLCPMYFSPRVLLPGGAQSG